MNFLSQTLPILFIFMLLFLTTQRKQLLTILLILEMIMIVTIFIMMTIMPKTMTEMFTIMILLTFAATEASVGLAALVMMMRSYGTDNLNTLSNQKC